MKNNILITTLLIAACLFNTNIDAAEKLKLDYSDQFEVIYDQNRYVTYVVGNVHFITETGDIYCDSARWVKGEDVQLNGHVIIDDAEYHLTSDSVFYNMGRGEYLALGDNVELWSYKDSILAAGNHAFFNENDKSFYMINRPVMYINYPDTQLMYEVIADRIDYISNSKDAEAFGDVKISSKEFSSHSGCAKMNTDGNLLDLFDKPTVTHHESTISGELISIYMEENLIDYIDVYDSAHGDFQEIVDSVKGYYDKSLLTGKRIILDFQNGVMNNILCYGQAYSWYYPSDKGSGKTQENEVSGDTIRFFVDNEELRTIHVVGGARGEYLSSTNKIVDSNVVQVVDTIDYQSHFIEYNIKDSLISLKQTAHVISGAVVLDAHVIEFDTQNKLIEAFSADIEADTIVNPYYLSNEIQPNIIPVILKDGSDEIFGDYLLYSLETEKGRIIQSKTDYTQGLYYGKKLFREQKDVFYVKEGRYTTCDASEPHFHFKSSNMKMIEGKRLIAKPVVLYIERIPILILPYYVFPLEKGRHSGFTTFKFGQFEKGDRYVSNVGYYWAASEYYDWLGTFDYYEQRKSLKFHSRVNFNKRYVLNGHVDGNYTRVSKYDTRTAQEYVEPIWTISGSYRHTFSPSFNIYANGSFLSDPSYTSQYSQNLEERQNRSIKSYLSFSKRFGKSVSLSGSVNHIVNLDNETRTDNLPNLSLSLPLLYPFGSGSKDENNRLVQKFYHKFSFSYNPSLQNYSHRAVDTLFDTTYAPDSTLIIDTTAFRTRKKFAKIQHNPRLNLPNLKLGYLMNIIPSISYSETWFKIYETDQSLDAGVDASTTYRTYSYSAGVSANTNLYGTIYPNMFGLLGLRHVFTPSFGFSYSPDLQRHPEVRQYTSGGASSSKRRSMNFSLKQLFQAKVKSGEREKNINLLSLTSGFSYNFENKDKPLSSMSTSFSSRALPIISSLNGSMTHSFYDPLDESQHFWLPYLTNFSLRASFNIAGKKFFFDDEQPKRLPLGADSASMVNSPTRPTTGSSSWSFTANFNYSESGRGSLWRKSSFINLTLRFNLTPTTTINYTQRYDITRNLTTNNRINIVRKIHCWTGSIYWVPNGSNRGFGFSLRVTAIPQLKIDNNYDSFSTQTLQQ